LNEICRRCRIRSDVVLLCESLSRASPSIASKTGGAPRAGAPPAPPAPPPPRRRRRWLAPCCLLALCQALLVSLALDGGSGLGDVDGGAFRRAALLAGAPPWAGRAGGGEGAPLPAGGGGGRRPPRAGRPRRVRPPVPPAQPPPPPPPGRGVVAVLVRARASNLAALVRRNAAVERFLYDASRMDVVVFHEADLDAAAQRAVANATPRLPLTFVSVQAVFDAAAAAASNAAAAAAAAAAGAGPAAAAAAGGAAAPACPPTPESESAPLGYKAMCAFWFLDFWGYVRDYAWLLRVDDDCELTERFAWDLPFPPHVRVASPLWVSLDGSADSVADPPASAPARADPKTGSVVRGLRNFTLRFAAERQRESAFLHAPGRAHTRVWAAPYTNVLYVNLRWARGEQREEPWEAGGGPWEGAGGALGRGGGGGSGLGRGGGGGGLGRGGGGGVLGRGGGGAGAGGGGADGGADDGAAGSGALAAVTADGAGGARSGATLRAFRAAVEASGCVYAARWGDMPLWGSALLLEGGPRHRFLLRYRHGSHGAAVNEVEPGLDGLRPDYAFTTGLAPPRGDEVSLDGAPFEAHDRGLAPPRPGGAGAARGAMAG